MKTTILLLIFFLGLNLVMGQTNENYSDQLLSSTFRLFKSADLELAYHMVPFIKQRFQTTLEDPRSFTNPYDSLSKYITIKKSSDSLLRMYCWSERNNGCRLISTTYAQFKTSSNEIKVINLEDICADYDEDLYVMDLQQIEINNQSYYLVIGFGGYCGNNIYQVARVFKISNNTLIKCDTIFDDKSEITAGSMRAGKINMKYTPETKTLSYTHYKFDEDIGMYTGKPTIRMYKLTKSGFKKIGDAFD